MPFSDHFLKKDKSIALKYRAEMQKYFDLSMSCLDKGEFKKSEMHFNHFLSLRREIVRMHNEKLTVESGELSDQAMKTRYNW
jgi:hypothetical protein